MLNLNSGLMLQKVRTLNQLWNVNLLSKPPFYLWTKIDKHWMTYFPSKTSVRYWLNIINCNMLILSLLEIANIPFSFRKRIILLSIILSEQSLLILEGGGDLCFGSYKELENLIIPRSLEASYWGWRGECLCGYIMLVLLF